MMDCTGIEPAAPWSDLPGDALGEIAGYLRDATDAVSFRAVCRPWREAAAAAPCLLPWLITPSGPATSTTMHFRSPLSGKNVSLDTFPPNHRRSFHGCDAANGRILASWFFGCGTDGLFNPLTGEATAVTRVTRPLPRRRSFRSPNGIFDFDTTSDFDIECCDFLLAKGWDACFGDIPAGVTDEGATADLARQPGRDRHLLEFQGELLCVDVVDIQPWLLRRRIWDKLELVSVNVLQVGDDGRPQWVRRDTSHLCLFLGWESSFAVDAGDFAGTGMTGGCAYFIGRRAARMKGFAVFRYSFQDGTATMVDALPVHYEKKSMWLMPRPRLASLHAAHK